jgi:hypothetical protein
MLQRRFSSLPLPTVEWIRGHAGDEGNETADKLANAGRQHGPVVSVRRNFQHLLRLTKREDVNSAGCIRTTHQYVLYPIAKHERKQPLYKLLETSSGIRLYV